jgi:hypothetical protein
VATRIETPQLTVPAGTPVSAPVSLPLYANRALLTHIDVRVPPGPSGLVGFTFWHSSRQVIPAVDGTWVVADDETVPFPLDGFSPWPNWTIKAYNTDVYPHTLYLRLHLDDSARSLPTRVQLAEIQ